MPRKRQLASDDGEEVEQRATRRSLRVRAQPTPKKEEESEEEDDVGTPTKSPKGRGREKKGTPAKGRASASPRGRGKKAKADNESDEEEDLESTPTKRKGRSPRAAAAAAADDSSSPRRRSSRGASIAATAAIGKQAEEGDEEEEATERAIGEDDEPSRGTKRKADAVDEEPTEKASEEKRPKVEDDSDKKSDDAPMEDAESENKEASQEDKKDESDEKTEPEKESVEDAVDKYEDKKSDKPKADSDEAMDTESNTEGSDFVVVQKSDVPEHGSSEVQTCLPKPITANKDTSENSGSAPSTNQNTEHKAPASGSVTESDMTDMDDEKVAHDALFNRTYVMNPHIDHSSIDSANSFTVASYNILAECHAVKGRRMWNQYTWCTEEKLSNNYRHAVIWKELEYLDADIYCLQEVPPAYYYDILVPAYKAKGYSGGFIKRAHVDYDEGEATFIREERFSVVSMKGHVIHTLAQKDMSAMGLDAIKQANILKAIHNPIVMMLASLRCRRTGATLQVANIHVSWDKFLKPDLQCVQIACAIRELVSAAGGAENPHIICGDFNSPPDSAGYYLARHGNLNELHTNAMRDIKAVNTLTGEKISAIDLWDKGFQHTSKHLRSAYLTATGGEPISSCFPHDGVCRAVDYVWFSEGSLKLAGVLDLAGTEQDIRNGIPDDEFPSDHLSVKAKLAFSS